MTPQRGVGPRVLAGRVAAGVLAVLGALAWVVALASPAAEPDAVAIAAATTPSVVCGALLLWRAPERSVSWALGLMAAAFTSWVISPAVAPDTPPGSLAAALGGLSWAFGLPMIPVVLLHFPYPPQRGWGRRLIWIQVGCVAVTALVMVTGSDDGDPLWAFRIGQAALISLLASAVLAVARLVRLRRRAEDPERMQVALVLGAGLLLLGLYLVMPVVGWLLSLPQDGGTSNMVFIMSIVPAAVTVGILGFDLYGVRVALNRAIGLLVLLGLAGLGAVAVVAVLRGLLDVPADSPALVGAVAVGIAVIAAPIRRLSRGAADSVVPTASTERRALAAVARRLDQAASAPDIPQQLAAELAELLGLTGVRVREHSDGDWVVLAQWGTPGEQDDTVPLRYAGHEVGDLALWPPPRQPERDLVRDLAPHLAAALQAGRLSRELARSREHLVWSREEERRRLRRDLHDELSPSLSGIRLAVAAARRRPDDDPAERDELLARVQDESTSAVEVVRRLLEDLRPPALEQLGLAGALEQRAHALSSASGCAVSVRCSLPDRLPAAVEVAAYRIGHEAMANAVRHSGGQQCVVTVQADGAELRMTVADDGSGLAAPRDRGVGLASMRERADALGGRLDIDAQPGQGSTVTAVLPLAGAAR